MKPFVVNISDLVDRPGARRRERVEGRLAEPVTVVDSTLRTEVPVVVDALLEWVSDGLLVTGTVEGAWEGPCRRCLNPVQGTLRAEVQELFESKPTDDDSYRLGHDSVNLEPLARESLVLDLPLAPLCREDCQGLCATCGADLNQGACDCPPVEADARWAALDVLRLAAEE
ncbi:MAG: DUF177 domain-containing protein [Actinomycetota bacterium]|nr:DUF177 domain-containing protein [Actinomycetota bacterium]